MPTRDSFSSEFFGPDFNQLQAQDPDIAAIILSELERQRQNLQLIASENFTSTAVLAAMGSTLSNKYAEGYPGKRYYGGCEEVDKAEVIGIERAKSLFGAEHANLQPHSGASANVAVYQAFTKHIRDNTSVSRMIRSNRDLREDAKQASREWIQSVESIRYKRITDDIDEQDYTK